MRRSLTALAGLFLSATLFGCGGSATVPAPPAQATAAPPPGSSPEMTKVRKSNSGGFGGARPSK